MITFPTELKDDEIYLQKSYPEISEVQVFTHIHTNIHTVDLGLWGLKEFHGIPRHP